MAQDFLNFQKSAKTFLGKWLKKNAEKKFIFFQNHGGGGLRPSFARTLGTGDGDRGRLEPDHLLLFPFGLQPNQLIDVLTREGRSEEGPCLIN